MQKGHTESQINPVFGLIKGTIRIVAASYVLAKSAGHYLDPSFAGTAADITYVTALAVVGFALLFALSPGKLVQTREEPEPITQTIAEPIVSDPIVRNMFGPMSWFDTADSAELSNEMDCDVVNIFADPVRKAQVEMVAA